MMSTDSVLNTTMITATYVPEVSQHEITRLSLPFPKPTVSLDARPVVIPIVSCVISFPLLAFAIICALRHRAQRHRRREHMRRLKAGMRAVTLEIPGFCERPSFFSRDSSSDISPKTGEKLEIEAEPASGRTYSRRASKSTHHQVKFLTTSAVLHAPRRPSQNGRLRQGSKPEVTFREEPSFIENTAEFVEELGETAYR
ncbi:uncharacterized protein LOC111089461 [Limulus polyphemus]|uniref:Uncharacterized protein LOC111089461 n=1 Tax=Limulus polyphemus TaxID=6850 RepID=A0ABM1TPA6_LIMPO|nr:uncharacterized protein LOC111089461 [Limulus polyphemus]